MKNEEIDQLTKNLLMRSAPKLSNDFEDKLMMQISLAPKGSSVSRYSLSLVLTLAASVISVALFGLIFYFVPFESIILSSYFKYPALDIFPQKFIYDFSAIQIALILFLGTFCLYFFDLFLNDFFEYKRHFTAA